MGLRDFHAVVGLANTCPLCLAPITNMRPVDRRVVRQALGVGAAQKMIGPRKAAARHFWRPTSPRESKSEMHQCGGN